MNPYEAPIHNEIIAPTQSLVPQNILSGIKAGWIAALVSASLTLILSLVGSIQDLSNFGSWGLLNLLDVALLVFFAFGVYKKSRIAATLLFVYFVVSKIMLIKLVGFAGLGLLGIIFLIIYANAMKSTFQYHQILQKNSPSQSSDLTP